MKISRLIWIILANALALLVNSAFLYFVIEEKADLGYDHWSYLIYLSIRMVVPVWGIYLEAVSSRFAKWVNVGYFASWVVVSYGLTLLPSIRWCGYSGQLLLVPLSAACVSCFLYSKWWIPSASRA
jgi:hypothetical protein